MEITEKRIRLLQRALNALRRDTDGPYLKVDGRWGRPTLAAMAGFLARRGCEGEALLARAMRALL